MGLTGLTDGLEVPSADNQEGEVDHGGLGEEFAEVGLYADGVAAVAAVADLIKILADGFQAFLKAGPIGLLFWWLFKKPDKDTINEKRARVELFRDQLIGEQLISPTSTINKILGVLSGEYSFFGVIFDGSKPIRDLIADGIHKGAPLEDRALLLEGLIDGWTNNADEHSIIVVLEWTLANEGRAAIREMCEHVGGPKRIRDQYESAFGQDGDKREDLDRIFTASYGSNWNSNPDVSDRPTWTAVEGEIVSRFGRTFEELAKQAYGDESYGIYLRNAPFNLAENAKEEAWLQHVNDNQNNNGGWNGFPDPDDDSFDPHAGGGTTNPGPPRPQFISYILTKGEIVNLHAQGVWQERFPVPGVIEHAHWFENFEMIAQFAYGDPQHKIGLKGANPGIPEIEEGMSITLPSAEELGPPYIEVAPIPAGGSGYLVWVSPNSEQQPEMWMGSPDRLVLELAQETLQYDEGKTAAEQLVQAATFNGDTSQEDAENAVTIAANLIDFIVTSDFGNTGIGEAPSPWQDASPGDTITIRPDELNQAAEVIYGHAGRAAWILAFNENNSGTSTSVAKSAESGPGNQMMEMVPAGNGGNGARSMNLPTWTEMQAMDPLPVTERVIAPKAIIEVVNGDTWSTLAQKAYGDWDLALKLAEHEDNAGKSLSTPGTLISIPARGNLNAIAVAAAGVSMLGPVTGDGPVGGGNVGGGNEGGSATLNPQAELTVVNSTGKGGGEEEEVEVDNREFTPGTNLIVKAGDTWSALATATYNDFSLFVKLSNHPLNVPFKTLPEGAEIYLPTLNELQDVPEFGLGLSPTGSPLLTEMVRIPTDDELHHVWVEDRAPEGATEPEGMWMMASKAFELRPEAEKIINETQDQPDINSKAQEVYQMTQGDQTREAIEERKATIKSLVNMNVLASTFDDPLSISGSVGWGGTNKAPDVRVVQQLLENANFSPQGIDGDVGPNTIAAIEAFQQHVLKWSSGLVEVNSNTWNALKTYVPIDGDQYRGAKIDQVGKMGAPTNQYETVSTIGANIRETPGGKIKAEKIKYDETIRILCYETGTNPTWVYVISEAGAEGWVNKDWVAYPLPEPNASLVQVKTGWQDVFNHYCGNYTPDTGFDDRHILVALAMANHGREGVTIDHAKFNQHLDDNLIMGWLTNQNENNAIYNSIQIKKGSNIWLYSWEHIQNLRSSGAIATRPELTNDLIDFANDFVEYDEIMKFFGNADDIMAALKNNPTQFIQNLVDAVLGGFQQFGENAESHIFSGITDWLFGNPDIDFPTSITDLPGYANMALDILDINLEAEMRRVVNNDQLFDAAKTGYGMFQNLLKNGPGAVWAELGGQVTGMAEEIKDSLIDELKTFAQNKIIIETGKRLAAMFVPGAGLLAALKNIWDLISALYQQAEKIVEMLQVISSAMADIANGNLINAKNQIETGLGQISSILIGTLFDFLNLGKIRSFIDKMRGKVLGILDKIGEFVQGKLTTYGINNNLGIAGNSESDNRPVNRLSTETSKEGNDKVKAYPLTEDGLTSGSAYSSYNSVPGWNHARLCNLKYDEWVRAHKISHQIGGPGNLSPVDNLFITDKKANADFKKYAEKPAQDQLEALSKMTPDDSKYAQYKDKVMFYEVEYDMHGSSYPLHGFAKEVTFKWGYVHVGANDQLGFKSETKTKTINCQKPQENPDDVVFNINTTGWDTLWDVTKQDSSHQMKSNFWQDVTAYRNKHNIVYKSISDLRSKLLNWGERKTSKNVVWEQCAILYHYTNNQILRF